MGKKRTTYAYEPDYAVAPGETLKETLDTLGMKQNELALRTGLSKISINRIANGNEPISFETAYKLEMATGVPAALWNNLEAQYKERMTRIQEREQLACDWDWLKTIPYKELIKRKYIDPITDKIELLRQTLKFYGVSHVKAWEEYWASQAIAPRQSQTFASHPGSTSAWIRIGEIEGQKVSCEPYDKELFKTNLTQIRNLTREKSPTIFVTEMIRLCREAGVALVLVPEIKGLTWHGASKWLTPRKALIILNLRGKREDQFWFSFFHEASHILNDKKTDLFINTGKASEECEVRANTFAHNILIPKQYQSEISSLGSKKAVISFANQIKLTPGIVAGQYQKMTGQWNRYNDLIRKLRWIDDD